MICIVYRSIAEAKKIKPSDTSADKTLLGGEAPPPRTIPKHTEKIMLIKTEKPKRSLFRDVLPIDIAYIATEIINDFSDREFFNHNSKATGNKGSTS